MRKQIKFNTPDMLHSAKENTGIFYMGICLVFVSECTGHDIVETSVCERTAGSQSIRQ